MVYILSFSRTPWVHCLYIVITEMYFHMYYFIVIVKGDVQVDYGRRTGCFLGDVQFDYGRRNVFFIFVLATFLPVYTRGCVTSG